MIEKSFVEQKQDNFRIEIRRKQIDEEFQKKRYELLSMKLAQQQR